MLRDLPHVDGACLDGPTIDRLRATPSTHPPRILLLYGSLRERSYSRFLTQEAERLLKHFGAETRIFDPHGLPLPDDAEVSHPKVKELRDLSLWSEGQVWTSRTPDVVRSNSEMPRSSSKSRTWRLTLDTFMPRAPAAPEKLICSAAAST